MNKDAEDSLAALLPEDAGEYAAGLESILVRIPPRWGRAIRCHAGWYPLLISTDEKIAAVAPEYEIHQVKEKFGTLRFYWGWPELQPACCHERLGSDPRPVDGHVDAKWAPPGRTPQEQQALEAWWAREIEHLESSQHRAADEALDPVRQARAEVDEVVSEIVERAELASAEICEMCGGAGTVSTRRYWVKTVCCECEEKDEYSS